jgi:hypothetical protein
VEEDHQDWEAVSNLLFNISEYNPNSAKYYQYTNQGGTTLGK